MKSNPADLVRDDVAIDANIAQIFPEQSPLTPDKGLKDARAVWTYTPAKPGMTALVYLHGNNNYVTVDGSGKSRVPDWATTPDAKAGATGKPAAPLIYGIDKLEKAVPGQRAVVLVPEAATLSTKSFWAREPAGQYADPKRMTVWMQDCLSHLAALKTPDQSRTYLPVAQPPAAFRRVCFSGHSGAGLPLEEAAISDLLMPGLGGTLADLWLFDCTYWSKVDGFIKFCEKWNAAGRLKGGPQSSRFICVYKPGTQTEKIADDLRFEIAKRLKLDPDEMIVDHTPTSYAGIKPVLPMVGILFIRTYLPHDDIPTFFLPALLETAG